MNFISLEITINSADILKNVNFFNRKRMYTRVSLIGNNQITTQKTHVDEYNGSKPFWWFKMKFQVEESKIHKKSCMLVFQVRCSKTLGDKDIGFLYLPVKELFDFDGGQKYPRDVAYTVATQSGKPKGVLYLTYKFGERVGTSSVIRVKRVDEETIRFGPVPSAPPCFLLEGGFPAGTTPVAPSSAALYRRRFMLIVDSYGAILGFLLISLLFIGSIIFVVYFGILVHRSKSY